MLIQKERKMAKKEGIIRPLKPGDIPQVVVLHLSLPGFLSQLGPGFLEKFYKIALSLPECLTLVYMKDEQILGFVSGSLRMEGLFSRIFFRDIFGFIFLLLKHFFTHPKDFKKAWQIFCYPGWQKKDPELLTIVVAEKYQRKGIGRKLFYALTGEFKKKGADHFFVSVYADLNANFFYQKLGGRLVKSFSFLGKKMNYYLFSG